MENNNFTSSSKLKQDSKMSKSKILQNKALKKTAEKNPVKFEDMIVDYNHDY